MQTLIGLNQNPKEVILLRIMEKPIDLNRGEGSIAATIKDTRTK